MVGDPGIEPGMSLLGGVTVRCRTLQHVAHWWREIAGGAHGVKGSGQGFYPCTAFPLADPFALRFVLDSAFGLRIFMARKLAPDGDSTMKKPAWVVDKERNKRAEAKETV